MPSEGSLLPVCQACGSQYDLAAGKTPQRCKICDDPRQFIPPSGQAWTTLQGLRENHQNHWQECQDLKGAWYFWTEPKFGIGQRAWLLQTPHGNVLWDMIALIDQATIDFIKSKGDLRAIVISHPHYYTTYVEWHTAFKCPIIIAKDDQEWLCRDPPKAAEQEHQGEQQQQQQHHQLLQSSQPLSVAGTSSATAASDTTIGTSTEQGCRGTTVSPGSKSSSETIEVIKWFEGPPTATMEVVPGVTAIKAGGHFPGSLLLHWQQGLWIADTIVTVPSAYTPHPRPSGQTTFTFQWSIPNYIPLPPDQILQIWKSLEPFEFEHTHGAFVGMDLWDKGIKGRLLESMKIQVRAEGHDEKDEGAEILRVGV